MSESSIFGLDDAGLLAVALAETIADDVESSPVDARAELEQEYENAVLRHSEGDATAAADVERLEAELAAVELAQRRAAALARAEVARVRKVEAERVAAERKADEARRMKARAELEQVQVRLKEAADRFAVEAGEVVSLYVEAMNSGAGHRVVAEALRTAVFAKCADPWRHRILRELGGQPPASNRGPVQ